MIDAKRVKELVELASKDRKISARIVVGRRCVVPREKSPPFRSGTRVFKACELTGRFYASTDGSPNGFADRIWRVWRRIGYVTMVEDGGLVDLGTVPLVLATIQRATWALGRRARVLVIMAGACSRPRRAAMGCLVVLTRQLLRPLCVMTGDGHLEHSPGYEAAVRLALDNGCRVEVWTWKACVPPLYPQLAVSSRRAFIGRSWLHRHLYAEGVGAFIVCSLLGAGGLPVSGRSHVPRPLRCLAAL